MKSTRKKQPQEQQERDVKRPRHLKPYQRDEIIQRVTNGEQKSLLAKEYGVSRAAVTKICQRDNETKVEVPEPHSAYHSEQSSRESAYPMLPMPEAVWTVLSNTFPLPVKTVPIHQALNHVIGENVISQNSVPPCRVSRMDGYAVRSADGRGDFPVMESIMAGDNPMEQELQSGWISYITTGAPVPPGADAVVKVEDTRIIACDDHDNEKVIKILVESKSGQNIRDVGEDISEHEVVLPPGAVITPAEVGLLATIGISEVSVISKPRVGILSSGNELAADQPGAMLKPGIIRDCNRPMLQALLLEAGFQTKDFGICADVETQLESVARSSLTEVDVLITTGGVSMGKHDFIKPILERIGQVHFGRLNMKPGKPTTFATVNIEGKNKPVFALPGNPVSALVTSHLLVLPALRKLQGLDESECIQPQVTVTLAHPIKLDPHRPEFHRALVLWDEESARFVATSTGRQESSRLLSCRESNALICLPTGDSFAETGIECPALITGALKSHTIHSSPPKAKCDASHAETSMRIEACILTVSDRVSEGLVDDLSGPAMQTALKGFKNSKIIQSAIVADEKDQITAVVKKWCDDLNPHLIITSGGTGFSPRDVTPEAIKPLFDREAPGIIFKIMRESLEVTPMAALSRAVAGIRGNTLIITFPGSPKAVCENFKAIQPILEHALHVLRDLPHGHHKGKR